MSRQLDFSDPEDSAWALSKIFAGPEAGRPALNWFGGGAFAIRGDLEPIELLFQVEGVTIMTIDAQDPLQISERHLTLFKDVAGENFIDNWTSSKSGRTVPVESAQEVTANVQLSNLMPWYVTNEKAVALIESHGQGRDSSMQQFVARREDLQEDNGAFVKTVGTWQSATAWWPWMQMDAEDEGYLFTRKFTRKFARAEDLSGPLQARLADQFGEDWT